MARRCLPELHSPCVGGHENLPTGGQKPFTVMNGRSGEFEVRLNCGSHEQPAAGGFAQVRRSGPARNAFRRQLADRNDLLDDWLVPRCNESRSGIPPHPRSSTLRQSGQRQSDAGVVCFVGVAEGVCSGQVRLGGSTICEVHPCRVPLREREDSDERRERVVS